MFDNLLSSDSADFPAYGATLGFLRGKQWRGHEWRLVRSWTHHCCGSALGARAHQKVQIKGSQLCLQRRWVAEPVITAYDDGNLNFSNRLGNDWNVAKCIDDSVEQGQKCFRWSLDPKHQSESHWPRHRFVFTISILEFKTDKNFQESLWARMSVESSA